MNCEEKDLFQKCQDIISDGSSRGAVRLGGREAEMLLPSSAQ